MEGVRGVPALDARIQGVKDALEGTGVKVIIGGAETKCDSAQGATVAEDLLTREPNLTAIYSACDDPAIAAAKVAKDKGKTVLVMGYDGLPDAAKAIQAGDMKATIAQFPGKMAALGVEAAVNAVRGEPVEAVHRHRHRAGHERQRRPVPPVPVEAAGRGAAVHRDRRTAAAAHRRRRRRRDAGGSTGEPGQHGPRRACRAGRSRDRARCSSRCAGSASAARTTTPTPGMQNFFGYPRVLGHELAVEVLAVGAGVTRVRPGRPLCRAALPLVRAVPALPARPGQLLRAHPACWGSPTDGGLRERMVVPAAHLFTEPGLTLDQLVLVETLGVGWHAVARARPEPDDTVLVLGAGPIGLAVAQAAAHARRAAPHRRRVSRAGRVRRGVRTRRRSWSTASSNAQLLDRTGGALPSLVFDATGSRTSMEAAFGLTGACGTLVLVGHTTGSLTFANPSFHARELDVRASRNATVGDWTEVIAADPRRRPRRPRVDQPPHDAGRHRRRAAGTGRRAGPRA